MANVTGGGSARQIVYRLTPRLRILLCPIGPNDAGVFVSGKKRVLQQGWLGDDGSWDWRDVETVEEEIRAEPGA